MAITSDGLQNYIDQFIKDWFDGYLILTDQKESGDIPVEYGRVFNGRFCYVRNIDDICSYTGYQGYVSYTFDLNIAPNEKYPTTNWQYLSQSNSLSYIDYNTVERVAIEWAKYAEEHFKYRPNSFMSSQAGTNINNSLRYFGLYNASNSLITNVWNTDGFYIDASTYEPVYRSSSGTTLFYPTDFGVYFVDSVPYRTDNNLSFPYSDSTGYIMQCSGYPIFTTLQPYFNTYVNITNQTTYQIEVTNSDNSVSTVYYTDNGDICYPNLNPFDFDDLLNLLNTIAGAIGINNNFITPVIVPTFDDLLDIYYPAVTGGGDTYINNGDIYNIDGDYYNVDFPSFTGEYPAETITPIESDINNIMPINSMPQLPSLTGIDNGESAAALGSSFTFLDGCGLLMPFVTIAIIRLLISKFRGDS